MNMIKHKSLDGVVHMLYTVQKGDTLSTIAKKFATTEQALLQTNAICNPEYLEIGRVLSVPAAGQLTRRCGGTPYYIVHPGDSIESISECFNIHPDLLKKANDIKNVLLFPYSELLIVQWIPKPGELEIIWDNVGEKYDGALSPIDIHDIFYSGSFLWEAMRKDAIAPLLKLIRHKSDTVKLFSVVSLARLASKGGGKVINALKDLCSDRNPFVGLMASYALERINLASRGLRRVHILSVDGMLYEKPDPNSPVTILSRGTHVTVLQWYIPGTFIYDRIQVVESGHTGFLQRFLYDETPLI